MRELRIGTWLAAITALVALGCDGDRPSDDPDGGSIRVDSGGGGTDSGPPRDSGMTMTDSGMTGRRCGPTTGPCDVSNPTSCGAGMACLLTRESETAPVTTICLPATTATEGAACDSAATTVQCAEGLACGDEDVCRRYCCSNADCNTPTPTGQICNIFGEAGPAGQEVGLCLLPEGCTLVPPQTGCDAGESCNLIATTGDTVCDGAGTLTEGMECMFRNHCVAGFACIGAAGEPGRCRQYCDMSATTPCATGFTCGGLTGAPANVGVCVPTPAP